MPRWLHFTDLTLSHVIVYSLALCSRPSLGGWSLVAPSGIFSTWAGRSLGAPAWAGVEARFIRSTIIPWKEMLPQFSWRPALLARTLLRWKKNMEDVPPVMTLSTAAVPMALPLPPTSAPQMKPSHDAPRSSIHNKLHGLTIYLVPPPAIKDPVLLWISNAFACSRLFLLPFSTLVPVRFRFSSFFSFLSPHGLTHVCQSIRLLWRSIAADVLPTPIQLGFPLRAAKSPHWFWLNPVVIGVNLIWFCFPWRAAQIPHWFWLDPIMIGFFRIEWT
jgi:hypothetical protein